MVNKEICQYLNTEDGNVLLDFTC